MSAKYVYSKTTGEFFKVVNRVGGLIEVKYDNKVDESGHFFFVASEVETLDVDALAWVKVGEDGTVRKIIGYDFKNDRFLLHRYSDQSVVWKHISEVKFVSYNGFRVEGKIFQDGTVVTGCKDGKDGKDFTLEMDSNNNIYVNGVKTEWSVGTINHRPSIVKFSGLDED